MSAMHEGELQEYPGCIPGQLGCPIFAKVLKIKIALF